MSIPSCRQTPYIARADLGFLICDHLLRVEIEDVDVILLMLCSAGTEPRALAEEASTLKPLSCIPNPHTAFLQSSLEVLLRVLPTLGGTFNGNVGQGLEKS